MRHQDVPIAKIHVPEVRVTAVYDEELQEQLRGSLDAVGQLQPIVLVKTEEGYDLVDGLHRLQEAQRRGDQKIPAVVYDGDGAESLLMNLVTNRLRGKIKASEMVQVIGELTQKHSLDSDQIAQRTGMTRDYIERLWKIAEAAPAVREGLDREVFGVGVAFEISRLPNFVQQEEVAKVCSMYPMKVADVRKQVDEVLQIIANPQEPSQPVHRDPPPPPSCEGCEGTPAPHLLVQVTLCPDCFGVVYRRHQEAVAASQNHHPPEERGEGG